MKPYLDLLQHVLEHGTYKTDRTQTGTISFFGTQTTYDLSKAFPLVTTKKMFWKGIVGELLWFLKGETNIKWLLEHNINIWTFWPFEKYQKSSSYHNETLLEFKHKILTDDSFAQQWGDLGPVYGSQWRSFNKVDQIKNLEVEIRRNPASRRLIVSAWNPFAIDKMSLPPCHVLFQFYVNDNKLSCQLYQRSADLFLGVPFNIASYSLLTCMLADTLNLKVDKFVHTIGDAHIYTNHIEQVKLQLTRQPLPLPTLQFTNHYDSVLDYDFTDIELVNYQHLPSIRAEVSV